MICEKCKKEHDGSYASGRFCSRQCANSRIQTKEQNISRRLKLTKTKKTFINVCQYCNNDFKTTNKNKKYCSQKCTGHWLKPNNGGLREGGGRSKVYLYESNIAGKMKLNKDEIEVAKILDELNLCWERNNFGFEYLTKDNKNRKYYPDFFIKDFNIYLEYKGWVTDEMNHKMIDSQNKNNFKLVIIYGNDKRYEKLGLNLSQIQNDKNLLLRSLM